MCNIDIYPIHNDTHSIALCGTNNQQTKMYKTNILTHSRGTNDQRLFKPRRPHVPITTIQSGPESGWTF